ncbi:MAG: hypothetical protein BM485_05340 [Desulfobulbaceae bacterium DB1]|nr:MAG: hypothetical protein BM485_05340 [Desulfobulbaceae bacterium DB1]
MNRGGNNFPLRRLLFQLTTLLLFFDPSLPAAQEEYSFDMGAFKKKSIDWGGYAEIKWEHLDINQHGALADLAFYRNPRSALDAGSATLQLDGSLSRGITTLNWVLQGTAGQDELGWSDRADIFEGFAGIKAGPNLGINLGKKVFKWGKGYAWSPVGFIDRAKDPNNPEEAMEGYVGAGFDLVKSRDGDLKTMALTTVALPVWRGVNEDFGVRDNVNLAAKLYFLYLDTDIDFIWYTGNSRTTRYGVDFSTNLATNFEIHGELAHVPNQQYRVLTEAGQLAPREISDTSYLLGLRYLTENDITSIVEFYHNDDGYGETETERFFRLIDDGSRAFSAGGGDALLRQAAAISESGYARPQTGRDYLYARITGKDPFDLLYFTPGLTAIVNLDDRSYSLSPEITYSGFTNWEVRLRFSRLAGGGMTEYGEKQNSNKIELRVRSFF